MLPEIKFDDLLTIDDWAQALRRILDAAAEATKNKDARNRLDLQDLLLTYIKRSPTVVESLDVIARKAIEDLALAEISVSLERISARGAELKRATDLITAVTAEAKKDARTLQMESTLDALTKAKVAIEALDQLEKTIPNPDLSLLQKLKASAEAIGSVAKAIAS